MLIMIGRAVSCSLFLLLFIANHRMLFHIQLCSSSTAYYTSAFLISVSVKSKPYLSSCNRQFLYRHVSTPLKNKDDGSDTIYSTGMYLQRQFPAPPFDLLVDLNTNGSKEKEKTFWNHYYIPLFRSQSQTQQQRRFGNEENLSTNTKVTNSRWNKLVHYLSKRKRKIQEEDQITSLPPIPTHTGFNNDVTTTVSSNNLQQNRDTSTTPVQQQGITATSASSIPHHTTQQTQNSFHIQQRYNDITEADKIKFLNAALQSRNVFIPSLVASKVNANNDITTFSRSNIAKLDIDHSDVLPRSVPLPSRNNNLEEKAQLPVAVVTNTRPPLQVIKEKSISVTDVRQKDKEWVDTILSRYYSSNMDAYNNKNTGNSMRTKMITATKNNLSSLSSTTTSKPTTLLTYKKAAMESSSLSSSQTASSMKEMYWKIREAIDMMQQRLVNNKTTMSTGSKTMYPSPTSLTENEEGVQEKAVIQTSSSLEKNNPAPVTPLQEDLTVSNVELLESHNNTLQQQIQYMKSNDGNSRDTKSMEKANIVAEIGSSYMQKEESSTTVPIPTKRKIIRMQVPIDDDSDDEIAASESNNANDEATILQPKPQQPEQQLQQPNNKYYKYNNTTTERISKEVMDRSKKWGIDLSKIL